MARNVGLRRALGVLSVPVVAALIAVSCSTPPGTPVPTSSFKFRANKVTVVNHNDTFIYGNSDEPFVYNLWFRVKVGVPNSAQVGLVGDRAQATGSLGDGQSQVLVGGQKAEVNFPNVQLLDAADLLNPANGLEIVGTWTWAMEKDDVSVAAVANNTLPVIQNALNTFVASGSVPDDPNVLVGQLLGDFGDAFNLIAGALFSSIPGIPDDSVGSNFYVGVAAKGTLASIIDSANATFPLVDIPAVTVPPNITGGRIFALDMGKDFNGQVFAQEGAHHDYDLQMINTATLNQPPVANFTASATSGNPGLAVSLNASTSTDPDGSIVAYNWNFGDFTTGSGAISSHVFNTSGTFPVTLTVTDNRGDTASKTINVTINGAPTVAPTNLQKVGSGLTGGDTYGDFAWTPVPGATAYEINMDGYLGGGCTSDASDVVNGQTSTGRVQAPSLIGLCLGSQYDVSIRAQANGQWGPWSPSIHITL